MTPIEEFCTGHIQARLWADGMILRDDSSHDTDDSVCPTEAYSMAEEIWDAGAGMPLGSPERELYEEAHQFWLWYEEEILAFAAANHLGIDGAGQLVALTRSGHGAGVWEYPESNTLADYCRCNGTEPVFLSRDVQSDFLKLDGVC